MAAVKYHEGRFPPRDIDWLKLIPLIGPANRAVARYEGVLHGIPNSQVLLSPLVTQEAVLSSKIEGTQATIGEVLEFEAEEESATGEKRNDIQEILNYRTAMRQAVSSLPNLPLSQRVVRDAHTRLMQGVRGENKTPGEYRRSPNWIGSPGCTIETARYVPPEAQRIPDLMAGWEKYLHGEAHDTLVQLAIVHAEFEAIHPFLDGNGRIGRLIVPLFLVDKKLLASPDFYISAYLEAHRDEYYDRLLAVSRDNDWTGWCRFFLRAVTEQASENETRAKAILALYEEKKEWITDATHSHHAIRALDWFFNQPIFKTSEFVRTTQIPNPTASRIVRLAREGGMLRELRASSGRRPALLMFSELVDIAEGRTTR
ncbi:MAG: Fic family protein [Phycisphaerales bacterium]|nr:Fic family protein [Phycisphaerales bacterium]